MLPIFIAHTQHLDIPGGIVDVCDYQLVDATALCLGKQALNGECAVFEGEICVTVEVHMVGL